MGQTVPSQHPAVVLRSHFNQLRALLAVALIAMIGLTVAVVILARDDHQPGNTRAASAPLPKPDARAPITGSRSDGAGEGTPRTHKDHSKKSATGDYDNSPGPPPTTRYDDGPDEGTRGPRYLTP